jgi:hypothetical protein
MPVFSHRGRWRLVSGVSFLGMFVSLLRSQRPSARRAGVAHAERVFPILVHEACDRLSGPTPGSLTITGASNEPESGLGDGDTAPDIVMAGNTVQVRAERSGTGTARIYTLTATASDLAANCSTVRATLHGPHDQRRKP